MNDAKKGGSSAVIYASHSLENSYVPYFSPYNSYPFSYSLPFNLAPFSSGHSGADGNFVLRGLAEGEYLLDIWADGYFLETGMSVEGKTEFGEGNSFKILSGQEIQGGDFTLSQGGVIFGTVTDELGQPVPCAEIDSVPSSKYWTENRYYPTNKYSTQSAQDGTYRLSGLPPDTYYPLVYSSLRFYEEGAYYLNTPGEKQDPILIKKGSQFGPIDFQLAPLSGGGVIKGQVVDAQTSLPISGIQVNLYIPFYLPYHYPLSLNHPLRIQPMNRRKKIMVSLTLMSVNPTRVFMRAGLARTGFTKSPGLDWVHINLRLSTHSLKNI